MIKLFFKRIIKYSLIVGLNSLLFIGFSNSHWASAVDTAHESQSSQTESQQQQSQTSSTNAGSVDRPLTAATTSSRPLVTSQSAHLVQPTVTLPGQQSVKTQKVARAATTYKIQDLIDQNIVATTVTWEVSSQSDEDKAQGYTGTYYPAKLKFTLLANNVLQPGDTISFGVLRYSGKLTGQGPVTIANVALAELGQYNGKSLVLDSQYNPDKAVTVTSPLPKSAAGVAVLTDQIAPDYTATYAGGQFLGTKATVSVMDATNLNGFEITHNEAGVENKGTMTFTGYTKDQQYFQSMLDNTPNLNGVPTENYVRIFRLNQASATTINQITASLKTYMPGLMPNGQHMAATTSGKGGPYQFIKTPVNIPISNSGSVEADATDAEIMAQTTPLTYGVLHNSDGSLTVYLNYGKLIRPYEIPVETITKGVMNNAWAGTQAGVDYALSRLSNNNYSALAASTFYTLNIDFNDPSIVNEIQGTYTDSLNNTAPITAQSSPPTISSDGQTAIKVHYADQHNQYIKPIETHYGWPNKDHLAITSQDLIIPGYTLDKSRLPIGADQNTGELSLGYPVEAGKVTDIIYYYTQNQQKIKVTYLDDTTGQQLGAVDSLSGVVNANSKYNTQKRIADYEKQGYSLVSDATNGATLIFGATDQAYTVHLKHAVKTGTTETKMVKQTIHYRYQSGGIASPDQVSQITFTRHEQIDQVTNASLGFTAWQASDGTTGFIARKSPVIKGYIADQLEIPAVSNVTQTTADSEITVTYTGASQTATVTYQRADNQTILQVDTLTGTTGETSNYRPTATLSKLADQGYTVAENPYPSGGLIFDDDVTTNQNITILLNYDPYYNRVYFKSVPTDLDFGQHALTDQPVAYQPTIDQALSIQDQRPLGSKWTVVATLVQPFIGSNQQQPLNGELTYLQANHLPITITDKANVIAAETTVSHDPVNLSGQWGPSSGLQLTIPVGGALLDQYQAQVEWTLQDGVAND